MGEAIPDLPSMASRIPRSIASLALLLAASATPAAADLTCPEVSGLMQAFVRGHVQYDTLDSPELEQRTIESWLRRADPSRSLLTRAELDAQRRKLGGVFARVREGECAPVFELHNSLVRQHERTAKFVRAYVSDPGYAIDEKATVVLDPEKRGNPASADERDALQRNLVHLQMATYLSNGTPLPDAKKKLAERYERRLRRLLETPDAEKLGEFLDSFATALDPHSSYLSPQVLEDFRIGMSLSLEGIGVALSEEDGYAVAERIIPGGAADRLKALRPKDKIIAVAPNGDGDYRDIIDMPLREAVALIRGKAGSTVNLTVLREGETTERFNVAIVRDKIDLEDQAASLRMVEREVNGKKVKLALVDLPSFYGDSDPSQRQETKDVERLLSQAREQGADGLLLDLSRNGGGLLQHAVVTSGFFLKSGAVVAIENGDGDRQVQSDSDPGTEWSGPLVVLVSRASASASEILAGALKDYRRAVIVGDDHTFGKGTVQTVQPIGRDQGALKVTTQLFFRPGGLSTQHDGVRSDVVVPSPLAGEDYGEKNQPYSIPPHTTEPFLSKSVNDERSPASRWRPIDDALVAELARRSEARMAKDPAFVELRQQLAERAKRPPAVPIAEVLEEREEQEKKAPPPAAGKDQEPPRPEVEEALNVLADLVVLSR